MRVNVARNGKKKQRKRGAAPRAPPFGATLTLDLGPGRQWRARAVVRALAPEAGRDLPGAQVSVRPSSGGRAVEIDVEAESLRALRASVNSYLRWATLAIDVSERARAAEEE